jgi:hypothetical protein
MKKSPQQERLEKMLDASKFSACGFMGNDTRAIWEIVDADAIALEQMGFTKEKVANRMQEITDQGIQGFGDWIVVSETIRVRVDDTRGKIPCPWSHGVRCLKRITTIERTDTGRSLRWSDLNIHLILAHGFFQGKGSLYRLEPKELVNVLW